MTEESADIEIRREGQHGKLAVVVAACGGKTVHRDEINLNAELHRRRFAAAVLKAVAPDAETVDARAAAALERTLIELAEVPPAAAPSAPPLPPNPPAGCEQDADANDAPDNPHVLAAGFLFADAAEGEPPPLRFWRETFAEWGCGTYRTVPDADIKARATEHVRGEFLRLNRDDVERWERAGDEKAPKPVVRPVTTNLVGHVMQAVKGLALLPAPVHPPAWIDGADGPDPTTLLPVRNGLLDLEAAAAGRPDCLRPHRRQFFTFNGCPYDFVPDAPPPVEWLRFLRATWPDDPESIDALQEWGGYFLTSDTRMQKLLFLLGPRRAGKGTVARVFKELVGPLNVAGPTLNSLATNFGLAPLLDKSLAIIDDARLSGRSDAAVVTERLLTITGEGTLTIDRKHRQAVDAKLNTRFMILSNELPRLGDASGALAGRMILLRFTRSWFGREDHHLFDRLQAELPGILLWAIEGWKRLRDRGRFVMPASAKDLVDELEDLTSPVGAFVRERCMVEPDTAVEVDDMYAEWRRWCETHGRREPGTLETFGRDLRAAVPHVRKSRPRKGGRRTHCYLGVRLRTATDPDPDEAESNTAGHGGHSGHGDPPLHALGNGKSRIGDSIPGHRDHRDHHDRVPVTPGLNGRARVIAADEGGEASPWH